MESKPGWRTTEFWMSIVASLIGVFAATGAFTPEQASALNQGMTEIVGTLTPVLAAFGYTLSRGQAKKGIRPTNGGNGGPHE